VLGKQWEPCGRLLGPSDQVRWLSGGCGAAFGLPDTHRGLVTLFITGRDAQNRSHIGRAVLAVDEEPTIVSIANNPILSPGELGAFDENGVSYPWVVFHTDQYYLYYTGWMLTVLTPFQNHVGLALSDGKCSFARYSRAPILHRTNSDFLSIGSVCVIKESGQWKMWYTAFLRWEKTAKGLQHIYVIKYATSRDGISWVRPDHICINVSDGETSISRPSVLHCGGLYHMWYCVRGQHYRIGYALSRDGISWSRLDRSANFHRSGEDWDSTSQSYPHVFQFGGTLYMLYSGNGYGRAGVGLARMALNNNCLGVNAG
jgi:predicted GH43/DUF377 family glycosyl hydrolase